MEKQKLLNYIVHLIEEEKLSFGKIAEKLEQEKIPTLSGSGKWNRGTLNKLYKKAKQKSDDSHETEQPELEVEQEIEQFEDRIQQDALSLLKIEIEKVKQELNLKVKQEIEAIKQELSDFLIAQIDQIKQEIDNLTFEKVKQLLNTEDEQYKRILEAETVKQVEQDNNGRPTNIDGWSVQKSKGYYRLFKKINGKVQGIYLGKELDIKKANKKIKEKALTNKVKQVTQKVKQKTIKQAEESPQDKILRLALEIDPRPHVLISITELRSLANMRKDIFDRLVLELSRQGKVFLHKHAHPYQAELDGSLNQLIADENGNYYMGLSLK